MTAVNVAQPDVMLLLDMEGLVREATLSGPLAAEGVDGWIGRPWAETFAEIGSKKIRKMVDDARTAGVSAFRQVMQRFPSGLELPMEYTTVLMGGRSGLLVVGKNLQAVAELQSRLIAAQQAMERDYWKLRDVETRYRLLFDASNEAVLMVGVQNLRIVEANPAALSVLGLPPHRIEGKSSGPELLSHVAAADREAVHAMLSRTREQGKTPGIVVHIGHDANPWMLRASLISTDPRPAFMLQLAPLGLPLTGPGQDPWVHDLVERAPDGFVVIDAEGIVRLANSAFVDMVEVGSAGAVIGQQLERWLWQPGADLRVLLENVQRHRFVRLFLTTIHGELGSDAEVEVSAVGNSDTPDHIGLLLRDVTRRLPPRDDTDQLRAALRSSTDQIGRTSLRSLVKNTIGIVEQHYMRAALELSGNNRTAAAEMLGVSRQSLYSKLNRYGLDDNVSASEPSDE